MTLTREEILAADDKPTARVNVPQWGGEVIVRTMTGHERDAWEKMCQAKTDADGNVDHACVKATLLQLTIIDDNGDLLFSEADLPELNQRSGQAIDIAFQIAQRLNGLSDETIEEIAGE